MVTLIIYFLILGILIVVHELGHFICAKKVGVRVEEFSVGFGRKLFTRKKKGTEYSVSLVPLGGYVKLAGDSLEEYKGKPDEYLNKPPMQRAAIVFCGPLLNYVLGFFFFWLVFFAGYPTLTSTVGALVDGMGAQAAGVQAGDKIISVDGKKVSLWEDIQDSIYDKKAGDIVSITVERTGKELNFDINIKEKEFNDILGKKKSIGLIGIEPKSDELVKVRHGFFESLLLGAEKTWLLTKLTYQSLWWMISGKLSLKESVTGPLGILLITSNVASQGIIAVLNFIALLSISLGIFNLLPLPVLDGGHILFLMIEKLRGKNFGLKTERIITRLGISLLILLALVVTYNDILRFGSKIFGWIK